MTTKPDANPNVESNTRPQGDPYVTGYNEGMAFQKKREENTRSLDAASDEEYLHCKISRKVWRECNALWQKDTSNESTFMSPEELLKWITFRYQEMKYFNIFAEGQGHLKGFLKGKGINVKTGEL